MMIEPLMAIIRVEDPCEDYSVLHAWLVTTMYPMLPVSHSVS
jgi:hypothetical protein